MKKIIFAALTITVISFIAFFNCNSGTGNMQTIATDEIEIFIESGEYWIGKMKVFIFSKKKHPQLTV
jgi:hypothetical protein